MNWFSGCSCVAEVKSLYRKLAKQYHPDIAGYASTPVMQEINAAYHKALEMKHGETTVDDEGKEHVYRYSYPIEQAIIEQIFKLLGLRMVNVEVELIGFWIWVHGDTRPYKEQLKALDCQWHSKRGMWYWRQVFSRYTGKSFDTLRMVYGSQKFEAADKDAAAIAA